MICEWICDPKLKKKLRTWAFLNLSGHQKHPEESYLKHHPHIQICWKGTSLGRMENGGRKWETTFLNNHPGDSGHQESLGTVTYGKGQFSKMLLIVTGICGPWCRAGCSPGLPLCFPASVGSLLQTTLALPSCPLAFHSPTSALLVQGCPL